MMPTMLVLCGGVAQRMRPLTERAPKSLLDVNGEPFLSHQLRLVRAKGIQKVVLSVGHFGDEIEMFAGDGARWGLDLRCVRDGERLLGTGGAVQAALGHLGADFWILYGDSYLDADYSAVLNAYRAGSAPAMMTVHRNRGRWDASNVSFDAGRVVRYDKKAPGPDMEYIDYGLTLTAASVWSKPRTPPWDMSELMGDLAREGRLGGYEVSKRFYEVGSMSGLAELSAHLRGDQETREGEK